MSHDHRFLFDWAAQNLVNRLQDIKRNFPVTLVIGSRTPNSFDSATSEAANAKHLISMEMTQDLLKNKPCSCVVSDEELLPFAENSLDSVICNLNLHTVNDLPGVMVQINRALKPDGLFLGAMLGGESLFELRQSFTEAEIKLRGGASPRVAPFADKQQIGGLLQRTGFALPVVDSEIIKVTYDHPLKLMYDLRGMGETNSISQRDKKPLGRDLLMTATEIYKEKFSEPDGSICATFEIIFLIGWTPHQSQQQPLKPGSAKQNLADALKTQEIKTSGAANS